jgi:hypothetical protein
MEIGLGVGIGTIAALTLVFLVLYLTVRKLQGPRDPSAGAYEHADDPHHRDEADWTNTSGSADPTRE